MSDQHETALLAHRPPPQYRQSVPDDGSSSLNDRAAPASAEQRATALETRLEQLEASDARYRSLIAAMVDGVVLQDRFGVIHECNPAAERILGLTTDQMMGRSSLDRRWRSVYPDGREMLGVEHPSMRTLETGQPLRDVVMGVHKPDGQLTWISICTEPLLDADGQAEAVVVSFTDITTRKEAEEQREQQLLEQAALRTLATLVASEAAPRSVFAAAAQHAAHVLQANAGGVARLNAGIGATLVGAWVPAHLSAPGIGEAVDLDAGTATGAVLKTGRPASVQQPSASLRREGVGSSIATPIMVDGRLWGALSVAYDAVIDRVAIKERTEHLGRFAELVALSISGSEAREQLARLASTDHLTGLDNQRTFSDRLDDEVNRAQRHGRPLSLVVFDVDHFKLVNDTHGHAIGNQVLAEFAERLLDVRRSGDTVARVGGEEFAWIMPETDRTEAHAVAEQFRTLIQTTPFAGAGHLTTSAGVCEVSDAQDARQLFRRADLALYWAKSQGRNVTFAYEPGTLQLLAGDEQAGRLTAR